MLLANHPDVVSLGSTTYDHAAWFLGAGGQRPRWLGYTLGYELVGKWLEEAGEVNGLTWVNVAAHTVLSATWNEIPRPHPVAGMRRSLEPTPASPRWPARSTGIDIDQLFRVMDGLGCGHLRFASKPVMFTQHPAIFSSQSRKPQAKAMLHPAPRWNLHARRAQSAYRCNRRIHICR